jgi:repressor LexA
MKTIGLTRKQHQLLTFLATQIAKTGVSPNLDEIANGTGLCSKGSVHNYLSRLMERGYVTWSPRQARSIRLLKLPSNAVDALLAEVPDEALQRELRRRCQLKSQEAA